MKNIISETSLDTMYMEKVVKQFLDTLEEHFIRSDKVDTSATLRKLVSMRYKGDRNIRECVLDMCIWLGNLRV